MSIRKLIALLLTLTVILCLFVGCTNREEPAPVNSNTPVGSGGSSGSTPSPTPDNDGEEEDEIVTIEFWWRDMGNVGSSPGTRAVEEAVNALTEEKINVHLNFHWIANADYGTQLNLAIVNKEVVDVIVTIPIPAASFATFYANGLYMDMTPYLEQYGQDVRALLGDDLIAATTVDGVVYALPVYRILNTNNYLCFRKDILEELDMVGFVDSISTWSDYETVMQAVVDNYDMYGTGSGNARLFSDGVYSPTDNLSDCYAVDSLGDNLRMVWSDDSGHIESAPERPESIDMCKRTRRWMDSGLVSPDSPYSTRVTGLGTEALCGQGVFACYMTGSEFGVDVNQSNLVGKPMKCIEIVTGKVRTATCQSWTMGISVSAQEPEAAMKFINLIYTDPELMNLMVWGIEGENYFLIDGEACYPEGTDASTCGYHGMSFSIGNQFLLHPWKGEGANFYELAYQNFKSAPISAYLGLTVDVSKVDNLVAALSVIHEEYWPQLSCGAYDDALYSEYLAKLKTGGVDEYLALFQNAVDEFLA